MMSRSSVMSPRWRGAIYKVLACTCFAGINSGVRYLSGGAENAAADPLPVNVIMFFQNIFGTLFMVPAIFQLGASALLKTRQWGLHLLRVVTAVLGVCLWYLTLVYMPIAEGLALQFTGPIFTVLGAYFFLYEPLTSRRLLAIGLSFIGAFLIMRPDRALWGEGTVALGFAVLLPLGSAIAIAAAKLLTRYQASRGEPPQTMTIFLLVLMTPVSLMPALWEWVWPSSHHWPWLLLLGGLAAGAHYTTVKAYALAEVTFLTPFGFSKFFLSIVFAYLAFSEMPSGWALWIGISVILGSLLILSQPGSDALKSKA